MNFLKNLITPQFDDSKVGQIEKLLDRVGYKKPTKLDKISQALTSLGKASAEFRGADQIADKFSLKEQREQAPERERRSILQSMVLGGGSKPTNDIKNYQFYAQQEQAKGREPIPYFQWAKQMKSSGAARFNLQEAMWPIMEPRVREALSGGSPTPNPGSSDDGVVDLGSY